MPPHQRARAPLKERPIAEKLFERVEIDIKGPLPRTEKESQFILVIQDAFPNMWNCAHCNDRQQKK